MKKILFTSIALVALTTTAAMANPYVKANLSASADSFGLTSLTPNTYGITVGNDFTNKVSAEVELNVNRHANGSTLNLNTTYTPARVLGVDPFVGVGIGLADVGVEAFTYNLRAGVSVPVTNTTSISAALVHTEVPNVNAFNKSLQYNTVQVSFKKSF